MQTTRLPPAPLASASSHLRSCTAELVQAATMKYEIRQRRARPASIGVSQESALRQQPLHVMIGHKNPRRDRKEWRRRLEEQPAALMNLRNAELDTRVLIGELCPETKAFVLRDSRRIVSFFLSSTFTDTEWERNLLLDDVVPYLQEYARGIGFEFRLAEMRWGIREEASNTHQTSEICMSELERCQKESQGYSYVFLACQVVASSPSRYLPLTLWNQSLQV